MDIPFDNDSAFSGTIDGEQEILNLDDTSVARPSDLHHSLGAHLIAEGLAFAHNLGPSLTNDARAKGYAKSIRDNVDTMRNEDDRRSIGRALEDGVENRCVVRAAVAFGAQRAHIHDVASRLVVVLGPPAGKQVGLHVVIALAQELLGAVHSGNGVAIDKGRQLAGRVTQEPKAPAVQDDLIAAGYENLAASPVLDCGLDVEEAHVLQQERACVVRLEGCDDAVLGVGDDGVDKHEGAHTLIIRLLDRTSSLDVRERCQCWAQVQMGAFGMQRLHRR